MNLVDLTLRYLLSLTKPQEDPGDCMLWTGSMARNEPTIMVRLGKGLRKKVNVRRQVFEFTHDRPPRPGFCIVVGDQCDDNTCVHPDHLIEVTRAQLVRRTAARGMFSTPEALLAYRKAAAERAGLKLSMEQVREIRESDEKPAELALRYGVSKAYIYMLLANTNRREFVALPFDGLRA